jgi:holo-[acyl-carrier protein] synthase
MVMGVGIDMVKIEKIISAINKWGNSFIERIFDEKELRHIVKGKMYYQRIAARFAAKEAVIKAVSKDYPLALRDIFILNKDNGAPYCEFRNNIDVDIFLSITHIEDYAVACAVAQEKA